MLSMRTDLPAAVLMPTLRKPRVALMLRSAVLAAGVALCSANAIGKQEVVRFVGGNASAVATVTSAPKRTATGVPAVAQAKATASGSASGKYSKSGLAQAIAAAASTGIRTDANGFGSATARASMGGSPFRQIRSYPFRAQAFASGSAEGFTWQLGQAMPARAFATAIGTTYNVAHGVAIGAANIFGTPTKYTGVQGSGVSTAYGQATVLYTLGAVGNGRAYANLLGDAAVRRAGVRYFEGKGIATAKATAVINNVVLYQAQSGFAYAHIEGRAVYTIGGKGQALATAVGIADGLLSNTSVTGTPATCTATMTGSAQVDFGGFGNANAKALGSFGVAPVVINTKVYGAVALATAYIQEHSVRTTKANGLATAKATSTGQSTKNQFTSSRACAYATAQIDWVQLDVQGDLAIAAAITEAYPSKVKYAYGDALAVATAQGFNQINDLLKASADRTLVVEFTSRLLEVDAIDHLLTV